jgi:hypothetical protein
MITLALPPPAHLRAAPQLAALALLDAALLTAEDVLLAHYPDAAFDRDFDGLAATTHALLAPILVARFDELRLLLERYDAALRATLRASDDDIPF